MQPSADCTIAGSRPDHAANRFQAQARAERRLLLEMQLVGDKIEIRPVAATAQLLREYTEAEIQQFLDEDKISDETANAVRRLLASGQL